MNVQPYEGPNYLVDMATLEIFLEAFNDKKVRSASLHKAGSKARANGDLFGVDNRGCWKRIELAKRKHKRKVSRIARRKNR